MTLPSALMNQETGRLERPSPQTKTDSESLCQNLMLLMDSLTGVLDEESQLVRSGSLMEASELSERKTGIAGELMAMMVYAGEHASVIEHFAPVTFRALREAHEKLKTDLQINLSALASARDVSEVLLDDVAKAVNGAQTPKVYGATGGMAGNHALNYGISVNRAL
ncbi:hypothetical protein [Coralliovum pocilloporae]|uniref:hypothetical protein n=1 Tax=Coralliovum pocilloporae TaxID=3066369 RepID=UPI003306B8FF